MRLVIEVFQWSFSFFMVVIFLIMAVFGAKFDFGKNMQAGVNEQGRHYGPQRRFIGLVKVTACPK